MSLHSPILIYDGICHLCHWLVQFILKYEFNSVIYFSHLETPFVNQSQNSVLNSSDLGADTVMLYYPKKNIFYTESSAIVRVLWLMGGGGAVFAIFLWVIPKPIRDFFIEKLLNIDIVCLDVLTLVNYRRMFIVLFKNP